MLETITNWLHDYYLGWMLTLGLLNDDPVDADFTITRIRFSPSSPAQVKVGEDIKVIIYYESNLKGKVVQIWAYPESSNLNGTYQASDREPANGMVTRTMSLSDEGHVSGITVNIVHVSGQDMLSKTYPVDYTLVTNPEIEALRGDGVGSHLSILLVEWDGMKISPNANVKIGESIKVTIKYDNKAREEVALWARGTMDDQMPCSYDSGEMPDEPQGTVVKYFTVDQALTLDGIYVNMNNIAGETIAEQWLDFPIHFVH